MLGQEFSIGDDDSHDEVEPQIKVGYVGTYNKGDEQTPTVGIKAFGFEMAAFGTKLLLDDAVS